MSATDGTYIDTVEEMGDAPWQPPRNEPIENTYIGFDPLMSCGDSMSLRTLKRVYRKHVMNDESIGWDELSDELLDTLAQIMGDDEFVRWKETDGRD